ncbi:hypothetical protein ABL78_2081 [Leptomonas seymouri]|uniref:Uncharacterized protein n=1 Tax=Leptomonas seymouri TaxID=5684 RepID=A0A0N1PCM2_LEPSE|nr:hypothetical protein ABL78_2081 [Leptomonas seymouri]|eukprot:KPI88822.1 hypothetical protein ABL78_2081 [Leptomonas seymouri]
MDITAESSTFVQSEANASIGAGSTAKYNEQANKREALHASDEEDTTNPYEPEDKEQPESRGDSTTVSEATHSSSASPDFSGSATPPRDAAQTSGHSARGAMVAATERDGSKLGDEALRLTRSYAESTSGLVASAPPHNAPAPQASQTQDQWSRQLQPSPNTSAAFPEDVSQVVASAAAAASAASLLQQSHGSDNTSPIRSNFVGGPGGPGRSALGAARSSAPSAPQTANSSALYPFSDSYAISQGAGAHAPSFNTGYVTPTNATLNRVTANNNTSAPSHAYPPAPYVAKSPEMEFVGRSGPRPNPFAASAASAGAVTVARNSPSKEGQLVVIPVSTGDGDADAQHSKRKRQWSPPEDADLPRRSRRLHLQDEADDEQYAEDYTDDEGNEEEASDDGSYSTGSYSYSTGSYSYSGYYSDSDEEDEEVDDEYEYYEEFYEEEIEEDEEDEEEPRIDVINGHGHGNTLHDILYGTPKAGINPRNDYSKDFTESLRAKSPYSRNAGKAKESRRSNLRHHRLREVEEKVGKGQRKRPVTPTESSQASSDAEKHEEEKDVSTAVALVPVRDATPERVARRHHQTKPTKRGEEEQQQQHAASAVKAEDGKKPYKHGEPYTEGTYKPKKKNASKRGKAKAHYGRTKDLDGALASSEDDSSDAASSSSDDVLHEPVTAAAGAASANAVDFSESSLYSGRSSNSHDEFTNPSGSISRRRQHRAEAKAKKAARVVAGVEGPIEPPASSSSDAAADKAEGKVTKKKSAGLGSPDAGEVVVAEEPIKTPPTLKAGDTEEEDKTKVDGEGKAVSPKTDANAADATLKETAAADATKDATKKKKSRVFGFMSKLSKKDKSKAAADGKEDGAKEKKGGIFDRLCTCGNKKSTKDAVASKNGSVKDTKAADKAKAKKDSMLAATAPATAPVDHQSDSKSTKKDEKAEGVATPAAAEAPATAEQAKEQPAQAVAAVAAPPSSAPPSATMADEVESSTDSVHAPGLGEAKRRHTQTPSTSAFTATAAALANTVESKKKKGKKASRNTHRRPNEEESKHKQEGGGGGDEIAVEDTSTLEAAQPSGHHRHARAGKERRKKNGVAAREETSIAQDKNVISIEATPLSQTPLGKTKNAPPAPSAKKDARNAWDDVD